MILLAERDNFGLINLAETYHCSVQLVSELPSVHPSILLVSETMLNETMIRQLRLMRHQGTTLLLLAENACNDGSWDYVFAKPYSADSIIRIALALSGRSVKASISDVSKMTEACLKTLQVPEHLLGYRYLKVATEYMLSRENIHAVSMMKEIYPRIATHFGTTSVMADRAIRHAVEVSWNRCDSAVLRAYLGYGSEDKKGMPTNAEYLFMLYERVRMLVGVTQEHERILKLQRRISPSSDHVEVIDESTKNMVK